MYILDRHGNQNRVGMSGVLDTAQRGGGMTNTSVPNAVFVNPNNSPEKAAHMEMATYQILGIVGVLAIGGYFLYKKMKG